MLLYKKPKGIVSLRESRQDETTLKNPHQTPFIPCLYHLIKNKLIDSSMLIWSIMRLITLKKYSFQNNHVYSANQQTCQDTRINPLEVFVFSKMWIVTRRSACCYLPQILIVFFKKTTLFNIKKTELLFITMIWEWIFYLVIWGCALTFKLFEILLIIIMPTFCWKFSMHESLLIFVFTVFKLVINRQSTHIYDLCFCKN